MIEIQAKLAPALASLNCHELSKNLQETSFANANVNQGFATKVKQVGYAHHAYPVDRPSAQQVWNIFHVLPRQYTSSVTIEVLERHPYTTQTFVPLGASPNRIEYMVVVAEDRQGKPDPRTLKAWMCHGGQMGNGSSIDICTFSSLTEQVTYNANQWHAPMIALRQAMIFAVINAENNTNDDLEEHFFSLGDYPVVHLAGSDQVTRAVSIPRSRL